ncbi:hypothetical protein V6N13_039429 [Hibiscus sabdariffa]
MFDGEEDFFSRVLELVGEDSCWCRHGSHQGAGMTAPRCRHGRAWRAVSRGLADLASWSYKKGLCNGPVKICK